MLLALLANTLLFNSYFKKEQLLQEEVQLVETLEKSDSIKLGEVESKERIVNHILLSGSSRSSYYLNRIAAIKPSSIGFTDIKFQPLERSIRPDKKIEYKGNEITITGESRDKADFSQWMEALEHYPWAAKVTVSHYGFLKTGVSNFTVMIIIKDGLEE